MDIPPVNSSPSSPDRNTKDDFVKKSIPVFLIFMLLFGLGILGVWLAPAVEKAEEKVVSPAKLSEEPPIPSGEPRGVEQEVSPTVQDKKVCASYSRRPGSTRMVQGSWTNEATSPGSTISIKGCYDYMKQNILDKPNCAQPGGEYITIVLINKSKHSYDMPTIDTEREFVRSQYCKPSVSLKAALTAESITVPETGYLGITFIWDPPFTSKQSTSLMIWNGTICGRVGGDPGSGSLAASAGVGTGTSYTFSNAGIKEGSIYCGQLWVDYYEGIEGSNPVVITVSS